MSEKSYQYDSRKINPGDTYICLPKGEPFIKDAQKRGATEVLKLSRKEMARLTSEYHNHPSKSLCVIGITGTNGKTTISHLLSQVLAAAGHNPIVLGTLNSPLTTPESLDIQALMADHLKNGATHFIMEVSSHGIDQDRVVDIDFDIKLLTNLARDHLDYHKTVEAYHNTKLNFMKTYPGVSIYPKAYQSQPINFKNPLLGKFNEDNMKATIAISKALKISEDIIERTLSQATAPPGRFERVGESQNYIVIVDYAHTPDSLENVLKTSQEIKVPEGKITTVFGCGGDRDRGKRAEMAKIASDYSDAIIITNDNPRTEDPDQIFEDIKKGLSNNQTPTTIIPDRKEAIQEAIKAAQKNDIILIAGKGHEDYQLIGTTKHPFDDRKIAMESIKKRHSENKLT